MGNINILERQAAYAMNEDLEFLCTHEDFTVDPPCCSGRDNEGNPSCACHGQYGIVCRNPDCTGITDSEAESMIDHFHIENFLGGQDE